MRGLSAAIVAMALLPFTATASTYNLLLERDVDVGGTDLFLITFPTLDAFVNSTNFTQFNTQIPVDPNFSVGGFAYDGTYQMLLERDVDVGGTDLFLITFPTLDDFVNSTNFTQFNTQIPVDPNFSAGGFAFDGTYQLLLERDVDVGGTDLFLITFPTLDDLIDSTGFTQFNTQIPLDPNFSVGGFAYDGFPPSEPPPIPLPATSLLLLGGIGALMAGRRRK
jgi:hypothetical protein